MRDEGVLTAAFYSMRNRPGWVRSCLDLGFSLEEVAFMEDLDDHHFSVDKKLEELDKEITRSGGYDCWEADDLSEKIEILSREIARIYRNIDIRIGKDTPFIETAIYRGASNLDRLIKIRSSLRGRQLYAETGDPITNDVVKAKQFPLEVLLAGRISQKGYIICPFHSDTRPSMLVKGGFGYCFSCHASCDSLKWLQEVEKKTFKQAVAICNEMAK